MLESEKTVSQTARKRERERDHASEKTMCQTARKRERRKSCQSGAVFLGVVYVGDCFLFFGLQMGRELNILK